MPNQCYQRLANLFSSHIAEKDNAIARWFVGHIVIFLTINTKFILKKEYEEYEGTEDIFMLNDIAVIILIILNFHEISPKIESISIGLFRQIANS